MTAILPIFALKCLAIILAAAAVAYIVLKAASWLGGSRMAWAAGIMLVGAVAVLDFYIARSCDPVFTPSQCDSSGSNCLSTRASFGCSADASVVVDVLAYFVLPAAAFAVLGLTYSIAKSATSTSNVG